MTGSHQHTHSGDTHPVESRAATVTLDCRPERQLIRPHGSHRHIVFHIHVGQKPHAAKADRLPLDLALVLDRSGSMQGEKIETAKRSARLVLDRLDERDRVAVVVFDDAIDVVQPAAAATTELKSRVGQALAGIHARSQTALHEGWLTGCQTIAGDRPATDGRLVRCFLLTDGLANVGVVDPEQIAGEAAGIYAKAGIGTSTFGIGPDYSEALLGPLAVAGGGQFHHLRTVEDITSTFIGELGDLFDVAAARARLELESSPGVTAEMISHFRAVVEPAGNLQRWSIMLGDLLAGDDRQIVVRFGLPGRAIDEQVVVRARLVWEDGGVEHSTEWQAVHFSVADNVRCDAEAYDPAAAHWMGLHHAERARQRATRARRPDELAEARRNLAGVARRMRRYAGSDADLLAAMRDLEALERELAAKPMDAMTAKEMYFQSQRSTRGHKDHRG